MMVALIGRQTESAILRTAIEERKSILVYGPRGAGKTTLLEHAVEELPQKFRQRCLVCRATSSPQEFWRELARRLHHADEPEVACRVRTEGRSENGVERWLLRQTSLRLRGILRGALSKRQYTILMDVNSIPPNDVCRFLQPCIWSKRTTVVLALRGMTESDLGKAGALFWHKGMRIRLGRLRILEAERLLNECVRRFGLTEYADRGYRAFILKESRGLPGGIVRLCEMASDVRYHLNGHIMAHMLVTDFLMQQASLLEFRCRRRSWDD